MTQWFVLNLFFKLPLR